VGLIPDEIIGFFNWPKPSSCTMGLGLTPPLREISTKNLSGAKGQWACKAETSLPSVSQLSRKCGSLGVSQPCGPLWPLTRIALLIYCLCEFHKIAQVL
jgi:hypothetical protein